MGVDIYGRKPTLKHEEPKRPENWTELSEEEQQPFYDKMDEFLNNNPGALFSNNWWNWRPLHMLLKHFVKEENINVTEEEIDLEHNDGKGIEDGEVCKKLAKSFNSFAKMMEEKGHKRVFLNTGYWEYQSLNSHGIMQSTTIYDDPSDWEKKALIDLNIKLAGELFFYEKPSYENVEFNSTHSTTIDNIKNFAVFLENCGGFRVY